jgi:hypothetical protein
MPDKLKHVTKSDLTRTGNYLTNLARIMFSFFNPIKLSFDDSQNYLEIDYEPRSPKPIYDICDLHGKIIKTGKFTSEKIKVAVNDLLNSYYVLLILDGEEIKTRRFEISRKSNMAS